jgi:myo-inositol 2-dehydrogenase/D-chiro-inositol 1-dehydrogenase
MPPASLAQQVGAAVADAAQVFADPAIDAVVIASSTNTHSDLLSRAAAARKHIFCEKPMDLSLARGKALRGGGSTGRASPA